MGLVNVLTTGASLVLAVASVFPHAAVAACANITRPTSVVLPQGRIKGFRDDSRNAVFLGIPFAATTGGENRYVDHCDFRLSAGLTKLSKMESASECSAVKRDLRCDVIRPNMPSGRLRYFIQPAG